MTRLQRELDVIAIGTIITEAWEYRGGLKLQLEYPSHMTLDQRREIARLIDNAETASRYL